MCGICGFAGPQNEIILRKMMDSIVHRGPDEEGFYSDDKVSLGIRRLSIIDPGTGQQPVHNEGKTVWAVFNGEIYNFQELRKELEVKGHQFYTHHSDTETIVHLYEEYGEDFPHKINGMFAIALWDKKKEKLALFRDRMGVKPLFYASTGDHLVFGSEIKAIFQYLCHRPRPNFEAIYHYFTFKNVPSPLTAFQNIYSVRPGDMVIFSKGKVKIDPWWRLDFCEEEYEERDVTEKILSLLEDAIRLRMISDVPFGVYLSGGVDSSTIVALMTKFSNKPIKTFSLGYEDELKNKEADLYHARRVSEAFKTDHYEYIMSHKELVDDIENVITAFDQPFSGTISTFFLTKLISKHVKVALTGDAADELFGSYKTHRLAVNSEIYDLPLIKYNSGVFLDVEKEFLLSMHFPYSSFDIIKDHFSTCTAIDPLNRMLEMEWNTQLPDQVLSFVDALSMAHSMEIRSPFLDYRLVEFVATIPGQMKIKNGNVKDILKKTVVHLLPEGIIDRPKEGFVLPIWDWMIDKMKDYTIDVLSKKRIEKHGLFNADYVANILAQYHAGDRKLAAKVWNLMIFQIWWEIYFG